MGKSIVFFLLNPEDEQIEERDVFLKRGEEKKKAMVHLMFILEL
jgi:hypothetical protein